MNRLWPRSLFGRIALILFLGLAAAHALTFALVLKERGEASWSMMVSYVARDVATAVAILDRLPPAERPDWLDRIARRNYRYALGAAAAGTSPDDPALQQVGAAVAAALGPGYAVQAAMRGDALRLGVKLSDGTPLVVDLVPPGMAISPWIFALLGIQLALLGLATWAAVRIATRPLARLAAASDAFGRDLRGAPLPEDGPLEVSRAAQAFNVMQRRIADHMAERLRILAAISHDLQTPITRMRLRAELLDHAELQGKLQADLDAMQALVQEGIAYARSAHGAAEVPMRVDLDAMLDSLVCDWRDGGHAVSLVGQVGHPVMMRPQTLRRIVTNLVDNAVKFAGEVEIAVEAAADQLAVVVHDRGPGIDPSELEAVLQPFYRLESSRNRATGGTGLGLAIAAELAATLGGRLTLTNRAGGGLEARLDLPLEVQAARDASRQDAPSCASSQRLRGSPPP